MDYGTKRIGLATGDKSGLGIRAVKTLSSQGIKRDAHELLKWALELGAESILVGLPVKLSGAFGISAQRAKKLAAQLQKLTNLPVILWDERLTSRAATAWMDQHGIKPRRRKDIRDQIAACLILEDYLSHEGHHEPITRS